MFRTLNLIVCIFAITTLGFAQNPIIQNVYTADPAPLVQGETLYLYTGHDEDHATSRGFIMKDYWCFSTTDMLNWTQHGPVFSTDSLKWASKNNANAAQVAYRDGKFYYYISPWSALKDGGDCIAVGVSDSPTAYFKDALGKPMINPSQTTYGKHAWEDIDPTILIDDDGQAYMYWGNNALYCVRLNKDMVSYSGDIITFDIKDKKAFGPDYEEAPWIFKRNGIYYLMYAAHVPEAVYYATATSPVGPWTYGGVVMEAWAQGSMGNHPGVAQFKGQWYFFYMNQDLPNGHDKKRAVNVIPLQFNVDGSIPTHKHEKSGLAKGHGYLNPFQRTEAETMAWGEGIEVAFSKGNNFIRDIQSGDYVKVRAVDFGKGAKKFEASLDSIAAGSSIEIRLDAVNGPLLATCKVKSKKPGWNTQKWGVKRVEGVHDVYFVYKGGQGPLFHIDWWKFSK